MFEVANSKISKLILSVVVVKRLTQGLFKTILKESEFPETFFKNSA